MNSRHRAREVALQILYRYDATLSSGGSLPSGAELASELAGHFEHFKVPDTLREFAARLVAGTLGGMAGLDALLEKHSAHWKISRMASLDRMLLRMASYELRDMPEVPPSVVIDEAIELAKQFGAADSPSFVNGILDAISTSLRKS